MTSGERPLKGWKYCDDVTGKCCPQWVIGRETLISGGETTTKFVLFSPPWSYDLLACPCILRYEQALSIKDQMLWSVLQDKQILHQTNKAEESLRKDYTVEIVEWINLTNRMADEITRLKEVVALVPNLEEANEKLRRENEALLEVLGRATSSSSSKREQLYE